MERASKVQNSLDSQPILLPEDETGELVLFAVLLQVVVPVFLVIGVGILLGYTLKLDAGPLNRASLYGAMPALVFITLTRSELTLQNTTVLLSGNLVFLLLMGLLAWSFSRSLAARSRRGFIATSLFGNAANMMLPVTLFAFGESGLERALVLYVFTSVIFFTVGPLIFSGSANLREVGKVVMRLPVIWAAILGLMFNLYGWPLPIALGRGLELLGNAAIPIVLLTLGLQIQKSGLVVPQPINWFGASFKLALGPLVGYVAALVVGAKGMDLAVLTLLAAMPPAVNNFILAYELGGDVEEVAGTVILGTVAALGSLSVVVWFFGAS